MSIFDKDIITTSVSIVEELDNKITQLMKEVQTAVQYITVNGKPISDEYMKGLIETMFSTRLVSLVDQWLPQHGYYCAHFGHIINREFFDCDNFVSTVHSINIDKKDETRYGSPEVCIMDDPFVGGKKVNIRWIGQVFLIKDIEHLSEVHRIHGKYHYDHVFDFEKHIIFTYAAKDPFMI